MSGRIDTPLAIPAPPAPARPPSRSRAARTIWLSEPIDLRIAVERLEFEPAPSATPEPGGPGPEEIARLLRDPRRAR